MTNCEPYCQTHQFASQGKLPLEIMKIWYDGRLVAQKKNGGIWPIVVSYTFRRLAATCANKFVINWRSKELQPIQLGVGVSEGAEAAIHSASPPVPFARQDKHVFVKLYFSKAFNCVRIDTILTSTADKMPELYWFVYDSLECNQKLTYQWCHHFSWRHTAGRLSRGSSSVNQSNRTSREGGTNHNVIRRWCRLKRRFPPSPETSRQSSTHIHRWISSWTPTYFK